MAALAKIPSVHPTPVGVSHYLLLLVILGLLSAVILRPASVDIVPPIDCPIVKSSLLTETDQARRALLRTDLRECLRQGYFKPYEVIDLFR